MNNLIIRKDKVKDLVLICNSEKVYLLYRFGQVIFNSLDYDEVSNLFNKIMNA